jgi:predicted Ser/Thr protein kinase
MFDLPLTAGTVVLDRYRIVKHLGAGSMGAVYLATHVRLNTQVAIKVITDADPDARDRFTREAELMARVRSPHVVTILDIGATPDGNPCIAMEFIDGESLDGHMAKGKMTHQQAIDIAVPILQGLAHVHAAGVLHRDLKPANVMMSSGTPPIVKVVDFGIARSASAEEARLTRTGLVAGTPAYMAPEQLMDLPLDGRNDLYAVGLIMYECVVGNLPFPNEASPTAQVMRRLQTDIPPLQGPPAFTAIVSALLARDPASRPPNAVAALQMMRGVPSPARGAPATETWDVQQAVAAAATRMSPATPNRSTQAWSLKEPDIAGSVMIERHMPPPVAAAAPAVPAPVTMHLEPVSWAVAAFLPATRLAMVAERQWLAGMVQPGRGFRTGDSLWFAVTRSANEFDAAINADLFVAAIAERFGSTARAAWAPLPRGFELSAASAAGAAPLPTELSTLIDRITRPRS